MVRPVLAVALLLSISCGTTIAAPAKKTEPAPALPANAEWARGAVFYDVGTALAPTLPKLASLRDMGIDAIAFDAPAANAETRGFVEQVHKRRMKVVVDLHAAKDAAAWVAQGVDGFRGDVAILKTIAEDVKKKRPDAILIGDKDGDTGAIAESFADVPMMMNYPLAKSLMQTITSGRSTSVPVTLQDMFDLYPKTAIDAPFLTKRGEPGLATVIENDRVKQRRAAAALLTLSASPFIRAGEEAGEEAYYKSLIAVRRRSAPLTKGWFAPIDMSYRTLSYLRFTPDETLFVLHNLTDTEIRTALAFGVVNLEPVYVEQGVGVPDTKLGTWTVTMPPHSVAIWRGK